MNFEEGIDATRYLENTTVYYSLTFDEIIKRTYHILTFNPTDDSPTELYVHLLYIIAGYICQSKYFLFSIAGLIYGYFYGRALLIVSRRFSLTKNSTIITIILLLFVIHRSFDSMQTIRSWTGMWILFNGVLSYIETKKIKYLFLIFSTPLVHLMYSFIVIPVFVYLFTVKFANRTVYIGLFVISFITNINSIALKSSVSEDSLADKKFSSYYRIDSQGNGIDPIALRKEKSGTGTSWYAEFGKTTAVYFGAVYFIIFLIFFGYYDKNKMSSVEYGLTTIGILMISLANFLSFAYTFYSRTMSNATIYVLASLVFISLRQKDNFNHLSRYKKFFLWIGLIIFFPKIIFFISNFIKLASFFLFILPYPILLNHDLNISIRDLINTIIGN